MFIPFARPLFACHSNTAQPRTFLSVYKFSGGNIFVHQSPFTQSQQPVFQINDDMVLANYFPVEIEFFLPYDPHLYCGAISSPTRASDRIYWYLEKYLSFHWHFSCSVFLLLDIQTFYYHKTHKKNSNYVAVLMFTCCAVPIYIAESCGQSTSHSHILSRYSPWVPREMGNNGSAHGQWKCTFQD